MGKSLIQQGWDQLEEMYARGKGTSKHLDKQRNGGKPDPEKIYTDSTKHDYDRKWKYFIEDMKAYGYTVNGHKPRTLEEAVGYMPIYLERLKERSGAMYARPGEKMAMSASTIRSYFAAPAKVLGLKMEDYDLPSRHTHDYTRSRYQTIRDRNFSTTKNSDLIEFCRATGLRNFKELQPLTGDQLVVKEDGAYIKVVGKGGRERLAPIIGSPETVQRVIDRMTAAGSGKVWARVPSAADIHGYRADYAARLYKMYARPPQELPLKERYCRRGADKGIWYDRKALERVSEALGHSRVDVVAQSYMHRLPRH